MAKPPRPWTVVRHRPLERIEENLHAVEGDVPGIPGFHRRMTIARRSGGGLLFFNAVPVDDATLDRIRAFGKPEILIVPHHLHSLDAHAFREKLGLQVYAPARGRALVAERVPVDGTFEELPEDPTLKVLTVAGFKTGEGLLVVRSGEHTSLVVADVVTNVPDGPGLKGFIARTIGFTADRPILPSLVRLRVLRDRPALRAQLEELSRTPGLARIVPTHGDVVERDPAGALRAIAATI